MRVLGHRRALPFLDSCYAAAQTDMGTIIGPSYARDP